jgi:hypothetical protein
MGMFLRADRQQELNRPHLIAARFMRTGRPGTITSQNPAYTSYRRRNAGTDGCVSVEERSLATTQTIRDFIKRRVRRCMAIGIGGVGSLLVPFESGPNFSEEPDKGTVPGAISVLDSMLLRGS